MLQTPCFARPELFLCPLKSAAAVPGCWHDTRPHRHRQLPQPANLVGTWRRFGSVGPVYEIIGTGDELPGGDRRMRVRVVETGEELDYRLAEILDDPRER